jgi:hypothetical protein
MASQKSRNERIPLGRQEKSFLLIFFLLSCFPYSTIQNPLQEMPKGIELARH